MEFIWYYLKIALYPVAAILVCGFIVWACLHLFIKLLGRSGYKAVLAASLIGTPIHELGHAFMCLLFGHKIVKLVLWQPRSTDGTTGYVQHTYNSHNLYQRLGRLFIGTGPIFSGMAVLCLLLTVAFPDTWSSYVSSVRLLVENHASVQNLVSTGLDIVSNMITEFRSDSISVWVRLPLVLVMLSVSLHINLSPSDIKESVDAVPLYLLLMLLVAGITYLPGAAVSGLVLSTLETFNAFMMAMFTVVLVFAVTQAVLALLLRLALALVGR